MTDEELIAHAKEAGLPSIGFARKIETARDTMLFPSSDPTIWKERRDNLDKLVKGARLLHKWKFPVQIFCMFWNIFALWLFIAVVAYGYTLFLVGDYGFPDAKWHEVFVVLLLIKFAYKGFKSDEEVVKTTERNRKDEAMLWFDRVKQSFGTSTANVVAAAMVALVFTVFKWVFG